MLLSSSILAKTKSDYDEAVRKNPGKEGASIGFMAALLTLAFIIFVLEIIVLFHAVNIAIRCSKPGPERISHVVLALFFTYPYLLVALFLAPCAKF